MLERILLVMNKFELKINQASNEYQKIFFFFYLLQFKLLNSFKQLDEIAKKLETINNDSQKLFKKEKKEENLVN